MAKIIGKDALKSFTQDISLPTSIRAQDLPALLKIPEELAEVTILVRNHQKLDNEEIISNDDVIYLFMAVMGG
jgi:hypothetical protein